MQNKKYRTPKSFVSHAPIFNIRDSRLFLKYIMNAVRKDYPNLELKNILKKEVKISSEFYKYFIKAPDDLVDFIDNLSIKSIKGK